jgi:hypothetical protein
MTRIDSKATTRSPLSPAAASAMLQNLIREVDLDEAVHAALVQIEASFSRNVLAR